MHHQLHKRFLCLLLAALMLTGLFPAASAVSPALRWETTEASVSWDRSDRLVSDAGSAEPEHKPTDVVRVAILLSGTPTLRAGYGTHSLADNAQAAAYDLALQENQKTMEKAISAQALDGKPLDVVWNLTLVYNLISANVPYGKIDAIRNVPGVQDVVIERRYEAETAVPNTASSAAMTGSSILWQTGLTGAGTRIAIIDTGTDTNHQSFDNGAYLYALAENAAALGMGQTDYMASLDLLDAEEIAAVLSHLNAYKRIGADAGEFYINEKLPFGANYVDYNLTVNHDHDSQGSHGSHVAGIAAANRYIPTRGGYADAVQTVFMGGVAPDAQIITMKVFGNNPGPSDSDYFAAIEDAIWLGCDSVNLSLGSGSPGFSENPLFADLLEYLETTDTVVVMSAGNSGSWAENTTNGSLYDDGVSFHTGGSPGSYTNSLTVASVDNDGTVGNCLDVAGNVIVYTEGYGYYNQPMTSLDTSPDGSGTDYDYIFIDGVGLTSDYDGMDLFGKVVFCSRGGISFAEKAVNATRLGAAAVVVYNNTSGAFGMDLDSYRQNNPCVSILQKDAAAIRAASAVRSTASGQVYYTGSVNICGRLGLSVYGSEYYTMSSFSSWGVPGSLELKPEITAPGGNIWSVNGVDQSGTAYELMSGTSMAAPQVTGMAALVSQYIRSSGLDVKTGLSVRQLSQSLLMSTAQPLKEESAGGEYYPVLRQGAGLARVDQAVSTGSYILVDGMDDGKVKVELGEDADRTGIYRFCFTIHDLSGKETTYQLSADLFTQDLIRDDDDYRYLDTQTLSLPANVVFYSEGHSLQNAGNTFACDLNGDGATDASDADYLLEYLVGNADALHAEGDVNSDGSVTAYDAHILLTRLSGEYSVTVPAGGSVTVEVRMELTAATRSYLDDNYPTGAYIEAFVYAEPETSSEGILGVTHSIPVLGYYGSWTEPSMYDIGSYDEYLAGTESRAPYLYNLNGISGNFVSITYNGSRDEYLFGGNPYVDDDQYLPHRNAFNNQGGQKLQALRFSLIRGSAETMLILENADTAERYQIWDLGQLDGAYYHVNSGSWKNTQYKQSLGLTLSGLPEGTRLNLSLVAVPELYRTRDPITGNYTTDYDALSDGAYLTTSFTIDNTAPVIRNAELIGGNILRITAQDNEYLAAAALMNASGSDVITAAAFNQTESGIQMTIELDLSQVYGSEFLLAVCDYAENETFCSISLELDTERPYFTALDYNTGFYMGLDSDGSAVTLTTATDREPPRAAEYAEGAVFEISSDNQLYAAFNDDLFHFTCLGELDPQNEWKIAMFTDMAYNRCDSKLYALFYSDLNNRIVPYLAVIDPLTGDMSVQGKLPIDANTIAIDGKGNFYSTIYAAGGLYRYKADVTSTQSVTCVGDTRGYKTTEFCSLAWDHNTDELYWLYNAGSRHSILRLDTTTASTELIANFDFYAHGLFITYEPESDIFAPNAPVQFMTLPESAGTMVGNTIQLTPQFYPWTCSGAELLWLSSDVGVATVDQNGLVTAHMDGTTVITALTLQGDICAECTVTVQYLDQELKAIIWDEEGMVSWSSFHVSGLPKYQSICPVQNNLPLNATMMVGDKLYASTLDFSYGTSSLYRVDPETYQMEYVGASSAACLDMAYSPSMNYGLAVYFNYVLLVDLNTGEYVGAWDWAEYVAADLVGITYYGTEYNSYYSVYQDYFLILDAEGNVYVDAWISNGYSIGYFFGPAAGYMTTIGAPVDISYFQSFHYDGSFAYWSRYNEADNAVELIAWDCDDSWEDYSLGYFPDSIWPVAGLYTDSSLRSAGPLAAAKSANQPAMISDAPLTAAEFRSLTVENGSLNHAAAVSAEEDLIHSVLTVPANAEEPVSGTLTVSFDPAALELVSVTGATGAFAWRHSDAGTVTIAFADYVPLPEGAALAQLSFRPLGFEDTVLTVTYGQWNQWHLTAAEEIPVAMPTPHMPFTDVPADSFYYTPVLWAIGRGITTGATATTFNPGGDCQRAAVVTFLWRACGSPEPTSDRNPFTDVTENDFFYKAVLWAVENGITNGTSATTFSPYAKCNRAQVVTFLWRAVGQPAPESAENPFRDVVLTDFYGSAVLWAVEQGITNGMGDGTFGVGSICNRAQVVTFLYRTMK